MCIFYISLLLFIERTIRMLKKFGQRPGVRRTFRFSSRTNSRINSLLNEKKYAIHILFKDLVYYKIFG